jgi:hypothetical protein
MKIVNSSSDAAFITAGRIADNFHDLRRGVIVGIRIMRRRSSFPFEMEAIPLENIFKDVFGGHRELFAIGLKVVFRVMGIS